MRFFASLRMTNPGSLCGLRGAHAYPEAHFPGGIAVVLTPASRNFMQNRQKTCLNCEVNYSKLKVYVVRIVRKYKTDYRKAGFYSEI